MKWPTLLSIVLPVVLSFLGVFYSSLPSYSGTVYLEGLHSKVEIARDKLGVPSIRAETRQDAMFALGFAHAQDRLWAMDIMRRTALGTLSELLGVESFELDVFARNLRISHLSAIAFNKTDPAFSSDIASYSDGINAAVRTMNMLPPEYLLTWSSFKKWKPQDSVAILQLMGVKWGHEFLRYHLSKIVGTEVAALLLPVQGTSQNPIVQEHGNPTIHVGERLTSDLLPGSQPSKEQSHLGGFFSSGSNAWVVSGVFTESGNPMLANDLQMAAGVPSFWYLATVRYGSLTVSGGTVPGVPGVLTGRNDKLAWALSYLNADTIDIYLERLNPENSLQYQDAGVYRDFSYFEETITVKGESRPREIRFEQTTRGPVLKRYAFGPKLFDTKFVANGVDSTMSLRWSLYEVNRDSSIEAFLKLMGAQNVNEVRDALSALTCCAVGVLYATEDNNIGFQAAARIPNVSRREKFSNLPLEGWKPEYNWDGLLEYWNLPHVENPPKGFIIAANNVPIASGHDFVSLGSDFVNFRAAQIESLLQKKIDSKRKLTTADMLEIQKDVFSPVAESVLPQLLLLANSTAQESATFHALKTWKYDMAKDRVEPTLFQVLLTKLMVRLVEDEVKNQEVIDGLIDAPAFSEFIVGLFRQQQEAEGPRKRWCDDVRTEVRETCEDVLSSLFLELDQQSFSKWGNAHEIQLSHNPFSRSKWRFFFHKVSPVGGSPDSVHSLDFHRSKGFGATSGPSIRLVIDLGHSDGYWGLETGESGNIFSAHYGDMSDNFHAGTLKRWHYPKGTEVKKMILEVAKSVD